MAKPTWDDLPSHHRAAIEKACGPILKAEPITGGLLPVLTARLHTEGGSVFCKAAPTDHPAARLVARERAAGNALPPEAPAPRLLWSSEAEGWLVLLFEHIDSRNADLSPGSPDLPAVLTALDRISRLQAWDAAPCVLTNVQALQEKAAALLNRRPEGEHWAMYAEALDHLDLDTLTGRALVHYDPHPGNLRITGHQVKVIDWAFACAGAPWIDMALLVPRLIEAGHTPAQAEALVASLPAWQTAPAPGITGLAALWTMFREYKALHGPEHSRSFRTQAADAGRAWITHRTR